MKLKYGENPWLCYMDNDSLIKTDDFYKYIAGSVEARFDTSGYSKDHPFPWKSHERVFVASRLKLYTYKTLSGSGDKKFKGVKKCLVKKTLDFSDYKHWLFAPIRSENSHSHQVFRKQPMFRNRLLEVYTVEIKKVAPNRDDNK